MAHTISERKAALAPSPRSPLAGWAPRGTELDPLRTPAGCLARGAEISGRCQTDECGRRVKVDMGFWVRHGFGDVDVKVVLRIYQCGRIGCGLQFGDELFPKGVPLQYHIGQGITITVQCATVSSGAASRRSG